MSSRSDRLEAGTGGVGVADKPSPVPVVSRREREDLLTQAHQLLGLAGEENAAVRIAAIEEGPDANGVPGGNVFVRPPIVEDQANSASSRANMSSPYSRYMGSRSSQSLPLRKV